MKRPISLSTLLFSLVLFALTPAIAGGKNVAYFAGGCFWCTEEIFSQAPGVTSVESGMMNNAETVEVTFDPSRTNYENLLKLFWKAHDPTEVDRQGPDTGKRYRSAIFYLNDEQRAAAEKSKAQLTAAHVYAKPIATEITRAIQFDRADPRQQDFYRKNPNNPYVKQWLDPKLRKLGMKCR
jgi:peptide-methionine (S)-S-oxide reductase